MLRLAIVLGLVSCGRIAFEVHSDASHGDAGVMLSDGFPGRDGPVDLSCVAQLVVGWEQVCVLATDGRVWCWGFGNNLQLGNGGTGNVGFPVRAPGFPANSVELSAGGFHACVVDTNQAVSCLGADYEGQLGQGALGPSEASTQPVSLPGAALHVACGDEFTCASLVDGRVYCWGINSDGEVGDGSMAGYQAAPVQPNVSGVVELAAKNHHACVRDGAGAITCWGDNAFGQIGDGTTMDRHAPTSAGHTGTAIAVGDHTCALQGDGTVQCWGDDVDGELGDAMMTSRGTAAGVMNLPPIAGLALGYHHACARTPSGDLWCWGQNTSGQVGDGSTVDRDVPVLVLSGVTQVAAGWNSTCALVTGGSIECWGDNSAGQLGDNTVASSTLPQPSLFSCDLM